MSEDLDDRGPSKSSRKREHRELQSLAESLAALPEPRFRKLALSERCRDALEAARRMPRSGSRNRPPKNGVITPKAAAAKPVRHTTSSSAGRWMSTPSTAVSPQASTTPCSLS